MKTHVYHNKDALLELISFHWGPFTNYVDKFLAFFYHLPPCVDIFYLVNVDQNWYFWTTYPPLLVNVICERPLGEKWRQKVYASNKSVDGLNFSQVTVACFMSQCGIFHRLLLSRIEKIPKWVMVTKSFHKK